MMRQFELVERVKAYDPDADEDVLNRAYVFAVKAHGTQMRASGDPYFSPSGRSRRHPDRAASSTTATIVTGLLHDTIEDTVATLEEIEQLFGEEIAPPGRRRHQAVALELAVREHQAGGEFPQVHAGDVEGHPRAAGQAGRPAAQHAHAALHQGAGKAPAHRARDDGDLRAAGRAHRHAEGHARAGGAGLRRARSRGRASIAGAPGLRCDERGERLVPQIGPS